MRFFLLFFSIFFYSNVLYSDENQPFLKGKFFYEQKNFSKAKLEFEKSIVLDPKKTNSYIIYLKFTQKLKIQKKKKKIYKQQYY